MDFHYYFEAAIALLGGLIGYVISSIKDSIKELQNNEASLADKVQKIEVLVAGTYVKRDDLKEMSTALFAKLDKIEFKLDQKVDK